MLFKTVAVVLATLGAGTGLAMQAPRWVRVDRTTALALYVDSFRIEKLPDRRFGVWTRWEFAKAQPLVDKEFDTMVAKLVIDCPGIRLMQTESNFYRGDVFVLHVDIPETEREWTTPTPESINETLIIRSCLVASGQPIVPVP